MRQPTTKPDSLQPATELAVDLFDNWFDPIEAEVRARSRQFIEELIRGELDDALARRRYGRSQMTGNEAKDGVSGYRHGSRTRSLTRHVRADRDSSAACPADHVRGQDDGMEEPSTAGLALQLPFMEISESMGNHDSKIVGADSVD